MSGGTDQLRTAIARKFESPIDVLLDPSLLVSSRSLDRLADSNVFNSQVQATLGRSPTEPRLGDLYVPASFRELALREDKSAVQKTSVWDFYRGQADAAFPNDVVDILDENDIDEFSDKGASSNLRWGNGIEDPERQETLIEILSEEFSFLQSGGFILSRTATVFEVLRDTGVPTVDVGGAELVPEVRDTLADIGYRNPAGICAFGVSNAEATADAITGGIIERESDLILYRLGD